MKLSKKKVTALALAVCLIAILSFGSLAWFTDSDSAKNDFYFADSETDDPDDIFSVDVWEDDELEDPDDDQKHDELDYDTILPGDILYKEVHIENTGHHDQYIRATVTISGAKLWQELYGAYVVPLTQIVNGVDESEIHTMVSYYDVQTDTFVYEIYYTEFIAGTAESGVGEDIIVFESVNIPTALTREQAAALNGTFYIDVIAHAVQTDNVGENVYEAFQTVGLVKHVMVSDATALQTALEDETLERVILDSNVVWGDANRRVTIKYNVSNKVIDFNGVDGKIAFTAITAENVTVVGMRDTDIASRKNAVQITETGFTGNVTFLDCVMEAYKSTVMNVLYGDITVDRCTLTGEKAIASAFSGNLTVVDSTFNGEAWIVE